MTCRLLAGALAFALITSGTVGAQGRGNAPRPPVPPQPGVQGPGPARAGSGPAVNPATTLQPSPSFPQFGAWLDDASTSAAGAGYVAIGASYWQGSGASQIDAPILGVTYGVTNRAQLSATVPFYRATYQGFTGSGLDNVYISGKVLVVDPDTGAGRVGLAIGGVAEILSSGFADVSRVHWAVPLSMEVRAYPVRLYGSSGYFSRGAFFAAGALEWTAPIGTSFTGALSHSRSVRGVTVATTLAVPDARLLDANVFVYHPLSNSAGVYAGAGRTFSNTSIDGAASVSGGIAIRFSTAAAAPALR